MYIYGPYKPNPSLAYIYMSAIYMVIYACKRLIFAPKCPKYDPIVLNKCMQHCQLRTNNTPTGVVVSAMHAKNYLYGSCATATLQVIIQPWCTPWCSFTTLLLFSLFSYLRMVYSSLYYTISQLLTSCLVSLSDCCRIHCYFHSSLRSSHQIPCPQYFAY